MLTIDEKFSTPLTENVASMLLGEKYIPARNLFCEAACSPFTIWIVINNNTTVAMERALRMRSHVFQLHVGGTELCSEHTTDIADQVSLLELALGGKYLDGLPCELLLVPDDFKLI